MTHTIFVGVDGSSPSHSAVRWAALRAAAVGANLVLVHVLDDEWGTVGADLLSEISYISRGLLNSEIDFATSVSPTVKVSSMVLSGDPMIELGEISRDAYLVVVGTHKTGFLHGQAFGSRSLRLAAAANSTVAVIPEGFESSGRGILAGVDDSPSGRAAVRFAAQEGERTKQEVTLVRARKLPDLREDPTGMLSAADSRLHVASERIMRDAVELARDAGPTVVIRSRSIRRAPGEALIDLSTTADLLVVGSSRRTGTARTTLGAVSYDVLLNLAVPTLIVHSDDAVETGSPATRSLAPTARP